MANILFPVKCDGYLDISMSYGHPYPMDTRLQKIDYYLMTKVVEIFERHKNNPQALQRAQLQNLSSFISRVSLLDYIYNSNDNFFQQDRNQLKRVSYLVDVSFHPGLDINTAPGNGDVGKSVYAVYDGEVVRFSNSWCSNKNDCGGYIVLKHQIEKTTFYSLYGHVNPIPPNRRNVKRGEIIATIAPLSPPLSAHLHFEISIKDIYSPGKVYPNYPYKQKKLNIAYLAAYAYDTILTHLPNKTVPSYLCVPNSIYYQMIVDQQNPFPNKKSSDSILSSFNEFTKSFGLVDPIEYLNKLSCDKLYNPPNGAETNQICTSSIQKTNKTQVCFTF